MYSKLENSIGKIVELNSTRFNDIFYSPQEIFLDKNVGWPGDWQGRVMLALYSHYLIKRKKPPYLNEFLYNYRNTLNKGGYYGDLISLNGINEQQLAGNSWFLRFLVMYYLDCNDDKVFENIINIINNLYLPITPYLDSYKNTGQEEIGKFGGSIKSNDECWKYSTDVGCVFIAIDGLSYAYSVYKNEKLKILIEKLINKFSKTDIVRSKYQTHASLTALRGIFKFYQETKDKKYLRQVIKRFYEYTTSGMTINFANYNWFLRENTWTEPCAIIDSFILAKELYIETKKYDYLLLAYQILYNALVYSARSNGGFGCDSCVSNDNSFLKSKNESYEAYWCCTMRGGEFSKDVSECVINDELIMPLPGKHYFTDGEIIIDNGFPYTDGLDLTLKFEKNRELIIDLPLSNYNVLYDEIYVKKGNQLIVKVKKGISKLIISFMIEPTTKKYGNYNVLDYGVLRLVKIDKNYKERTFEIGEERYTNVPLCFNYTKEEVLSMNVDFNSGGKK